MSRKILILLFGNLALLTILILLFDTFGIIDYREFLYENLPFVRSYIEQKIEDPSILEKENLLRYKTELDYIKNSLEKKEKELQIRESNIINKELELQQKMVEVEQVRANLEKLQNSFISYDQKVTKVANYLLNIPPDSAVKVLEEMDDNMIIDVLMKIDQISEREGIASISPLLLSRLPADRAARIQAKILQR